MGFENPNGNVWKSEWFGLFLLAKTATPKQLAKFIYDRGFRKGTQSHQFKSSLDYNKGEEQEELWNEIFEANEVHNGFYPGSFQDHVLAHIREHFTIQRKKEHERKENL